MRTARSIIREEIPETLIDLLRSQAEVRGNQTLLTFLGDGDGDEVVWSYAELDRQARAVAALLQREGAFGKRVLLLFPPGMEFVAALTGCIYAGTVAVSTYPPDPMRLADTLPGFLNAAKDARAEFALTTAAILPMTAPLFELSPELKALRWLKTDRLDAGFETVWIPPKLDASALCLLQYTSGSTGEPKGVMFSHGNVLAQSLAAREGIGLGPEDIGVSWIPLYHSMGIGVVAQTILIGGSLVLLSPLDFLKKPSRWLQAISRYRGTFSLGPNFAYELCARVTTPEEKAGLDLSSWRTAICGAEPVLEETLDRFVRAFADCGFRREALMPGYGLTEATLAGACEADRRGPVTGAFQASALEQRRVAAAGPGTESRRIVSCGRATPGIDLHIVNPDNCVECVPGEVGEIWLRGPAVAKGYWARPEETRAVFQAALSGTEEGPFLRTGDLGFLHEGRLFIAGRCKDLIVIRGRNHHPVDIERSVASSHPMLAGAAGAAFSVTVENEERLVILQEAPLRDAAEGSEVTAKILAVVAQRHGLKPHAVLLLEPNALPRTRNQKIPRYACREAFLHGTLRPAFEWREAADTVSVSGSASTAKLPREAEDIPAWLETRLSAALQLPPGAFDWKQPLTSYGLDSLRVVELARDIEQELGVPVLIQRLLESPSLNDLSAMLRREWREPSESAGGPAELDLEAEVALDPEIEGTAKQVTHGGPMADVFLTGATGFLGAFLLQQLLRNSSARVYCLVRARDATEGLERIRKNLEFFGIWEQADAERIYPVLGDLALPRFGMTHEDFEGLAAKVDTIYHSGAVVNFIYSYRDLKAPNVLGTQEILRLATRFRLKPVHYVSTLGVFPLAGHPEGKTYFEDEPLAPHRAHLNGYAQSKWVAEKIVALARDRGVPVTIHRVGEVTGHSRTGVCPAQRDAYSLLLKGCIQLGMVPDLSLSIHAVPVDYVAAGIFRLSLRKDSLGKVFHLIHPEPLNLRSFTDFVVSLGYRVRRVPFPEWLGKVSALLGGQTPIALRAFAPLLRSPEVARLVEATDGLRMDYRNVRNGLAGTEMSSPPDMAATWKAYFAYLQGSGFLEVPS